MAITLNKSIVAGNLTRDPEVRFAPSGMAVCSFSIANTHVYKQDGQKKEIVSYIDCQVFGKTAEACGEHLGKGSSVIVEGRIQQRRWEKDGVKKFKVEIFCESVHFLSPSKKADKQEPGAGTGAAPQDDQDIPF